LRYQNLEAVFPKSNPEVYLQKKITTADTTKQDLPPEET
jgi:hypothetical protein